VHGIRTALWFGSGIHYALERYYNPTLREDPETVFRAWFRLEWEGGQVTDDEVPKYVDREPERRSDNTWRITGLRDLLPSPDEEAFLELEDIGCGMMKFYKEYSKENDNFTVIATEHEFSVPVLKPDGSPLYMVDKRQMPKGWEPNFDAGNEYGPLLDVKHLNPDDKGYSIAKQVHARGRMDMIKQDNDSGYFGIQDYKTTSRLDDDYYRHIELDEQCTTYLWAGEIEARIHGLEYTQLDYITYQAMLKKYPKPPTITSRGEPSINRQTESATAEMYAECINSKPAWRSMYEFKRDWQFYYEWLLEVGDRRFIDRRDIRRNKHQKHNMGVRLYYETLDMLNDPIAYPNPTKNYSCLNCVFRAPCIAAEDGSDFEMMLDDGYVKNWDR
jgi:hypothetical protein